MTKTMNGIVLPGNGTTETRTYDIPEPGEGEVLVKMRASGICGSDIGYIYRGYKSYVGVTGPAYRGVIAGHEPAGEIVSVGSRHSRFGIGDRVLLYHIVGCGQCYNCRVGLLHQLFLPGIVLRTAGSVTAGMRSTSWLQNVPALPCRTRSHLSTARSSAVASARPIRGFCVSE